MNTPPVPKALESWPPHELEAVVACPVCGSPLKQRWRGMTVFEAFAASEAIERGQLGIEGTCRSRPPWRAIVAEIYEMLTQSKREFLTFTARKPTANY